MTKYQRTQAAIDRRTAPERRAISHAILRLRPMSERPQSLALSVACDIVLAGDRTLQRRESDQKTDRARRILIGARVPRAFADLCRDCAAAQGESLYRWCVNAFRGHIRETKPFGRDLPDEL